MKQLLAHWVFTHAVAVMLALFVGFGIGVAAERWANDLSAYEEHG